MCPDPYFWAILGGFQTISRGFGGIFGPFWAILGGFQVLMAPICTFCGRTILRSKAENKHSFIVVCGSCARTKVYTMLRQIVWSKLNIDHIHRSRGMVTKGKNLPMNIFDLIYPKL